MSYRRGTIVRGPDLFGPHSHRPYLKLSTDAHPFSDEEALYAAITTTERGAAIRLRDSDFEDGTLPDESYVNPWTITSIRHADIGGVEGHLSDQRTDEIARETAEYLGT